MRMKVYAIEFVQYTNCMHDTVWCEETDTYLDVGKGTFLIREDEIEKYRKYGHGIKSLILMGEIEVAKNER